MRTSATLKVYFHDLEHDPIMIEWGGAKRRRRLKPDTLMVVWEQESGSSTWNYHHVWLMGRYVHANSSSTISTTLYERTFNKEGQWSPETPEWVKELVDACMPTHVPVVRVS